MAPKSIFSSLVREVDGTWSTAYQTFNLKSALQPIFRRTTSGALDIDSFEGLVRPHRNGEPVTPGEFHTYAVSWDRDLLIWYVDGREVRRQPTPMDMHKPMYLLANTAIGGDWAGAPDATTPFPAHFVIDYIRAYRFAS